MCLAKLYLDKESKKPAMDNIAQMRIEGDVVKLETLFGESRAVRGRVREIDFAKSRVVIEEYH